MSSITRCSSNKVTFSQINNSQFLVEVFDNKTKIGGESEYAISYVDIANGPYLHIGKDFLGRGSIKDLEIVNEDNDNDNYLLIKVTLND